MNGLKSYAAGDLVFRILASAFVHPRCVRAFTNAMTLEMSLAANVSVHARTRTRRDSRANAAASLTLANVVT